MTTLHDRLQNVIAYVEPDDDGHAQYDSPEAQREANDEATAVAISHIAEDLKGLIEQNLLDGDAIQAGQMIASTDVWEVIDQYTTGGKETE